MRLAHHLQRHPSGVWHFRLTVPRDLRVFLNLRVIKRSLRTKDPFVARAWAYALGAHYLRMFADVRRQGDRVGKDFDEYLKNLTGFEIEHGPHGVNIKTDGSERDNQAALQALEALRQLSSTKQPSAQASTLPDLFAKTATTEPLVKHPIAVGKAADQWLRSITSDTLRKTLTIKSAAVMGFVRHVGLTKPLHTLAREDVHAWVEALRVSGLQTPTLVNKTSYLRGFFEWAVKAGHYPKFPREDNPASGHVVFRKREKVKRLAHGFKAFTDEHIRALYAPDAMARLSDGARWGAVIGLYTGACVSEVGQLALADFITIDGVPCISITNEGEGQSVKNEPSLRRIPIHPDLITLGLLERVAKLKADGETRLFPKIKVGAVNGMGQWLSKAFTRHIDAVGIVKPPKGKYGFHSLRKTAIQTMKSNKVPLEWRCAYVGHDLDEEHVETYSGDYGPKDMLSMVRDGLRWPLDLRAIGNVLSTSIVHG